METKQNYARWTPKETNTLIKCFNENENSKNPLSYQKFAEVLASTELFLNKKTWKQIVNKIHNLIRENKLQPTHTKNWTEEETNFLIEYFNENKNSKNPLSYLELANFLLDNFEIFSNKEEQQIVNKIKNLIAQNKLQHTYITNWTEEEINTLIKCFNENKNSENPLSYSELANFLLDNFEIFSDKEEKQIVNKIKNLIRENKLESTHAKNWTEEQTNTLSKRVNEIQNNLYHFQQISNQSQNSFPTSSSDTSNKTQEQDTFFQKSLKDAKILMENLTQTLPDIF